MILNILLFSELAFAACITVRDGYRGGIVLVFRSVGSFNTAFKNIVSDYLNIT